MNQKILIDNVVTFLTKARKNGSIRPTSSGAGMLVWKGYPLEQKPIPLTAMPSIVIEDGGEKTEVITGNTQKRTYTIVVELMLFVSKIETALDEVLSFSNEVKAVFEKVENRQLDGMIFGSQITPMIVHDEESKLYRGRKIMVEYTDLEDIFEQF